MTSSRPEWTTAPVWFIGAGPGDPELITLKGARMIAEADLVLYAGSLVPQIITEGAKESAIIMDSAPMTLEETHNAVVDTVKKGGTVARVHTGDPSLYGAIREQMRLLDKEDIGYGTIPGVTAGFAAAAASATSLTVPEQSQSVIITRLEGRTPVPETEKLRDLAKHRCAMAVYLSAAHPNRLVEELKAGGLEDDVVVVVAYRVGWPEQKIVRTDIGNLCATVEEHNLTRQTVFLVLPGEDNEEHFSKLYDAGFLHGFRA